MANWKIRDIAPPKQRKIVVGGMGESTREEQRIDKPRNSRPSLVLKGIIVVSFILIGIVGVLHVFFSTSEVSVWPKTKPITADFVLTALGAQEPLEVEKFQIPATVISVKKDVSREFLSTGMSTDAKKANGKIRVYNSYSTAPQSLIVNTRFLSDGGKLFRSTAKVVIPGMKGNDPGYADIGVVAAEAGESYNIGSASFSLPGLSGSPLYTAIYAKSTNEMTGGSSSKVFVVSAEDRKQAQVSIIEEAIKLAKDSLLSQIPEGMISGDSAIKIVSKDAVVAIKEGTQVPQFVASGTVEASLYAFSNENMAQITAFLLKDKIQNQERLYEQKNVITFTGVSSAADTKNALLKGSISALVYDYVDPTELKLKIRGKSETDAKILLSQYDSLEKSSFVFWPFWVSSLPGSLDRITLKVIID